MVRLCYLAGVLSAHALPMFCALLWTIIFGLDWQHLLGVAWCFLFRTLLLRDTPLYAHKRIFEIPNYFRNLSAFEIGIVILSFFVIQLGEAAAGGKWLEISFFGVYFWAVFAHFFVRFLHREQYLIIFGTKPRTLRELFDNRYELAWVFIQIHF